MLRCFLVLITIIKIQFAQTTGATIAYNNDPSTLINRKWMSINGDDIFIR